MSIDHGKLLALASEIQSAVGQEIEPDVQHVPVTWLLDWAERLRALAQPAEAVEGGMGANCSGPCSEYSQCAAHLAEWLERKYARHREDEDRQAAAMLRRIALAGGEDGADAAQGAVAWRFWMDESVSWLKPGWSEWSADSKFRLLCDSLGYRAEFAYPATNPQAAPAQGDGWKLVPVLPTEAMLKAGWNAPASTRYLAATRSVWDAMLAAAPSPEPRS